MVTVIISIKESRTKQSIPSEGLMLKLEVQRTSIKLLQQPAFEEYNTVLLHENRHYHFLCYAAAGQVVCQAVRPLMKFPVSEQLLTAFHRHRIRMRKALPYDEVYNSVHLIAVCERIHV